jgi:hypothetical protein
MTSSRDRRLSRWVETRRELVGDALSRTSCCVGDAGHFQIATAAERRYRSALLGVQQREDVKKACKAASKVRRCVVPISWTLN